MNLGAEAGKAMAEAPESGTEVFTSHESTSRELTSHDDAEGVERDGMMVNRDGDRGTNDCESCQTIGEREPAANQTEGLAHSVGVKTEDETDIRVAQTAKHPCAKEGDNEVPAGNQLLSTFLSTYRVVPVVPVVASASAESSERGEGIRACPMRIGKKAICDFQIVVVPGDEPLNVWLRPKKRTLQADGTKKTEFFFVCYCHGKEINLGEKLGFGENLGPLCRRVPRGIDPDDRCAAAAHFAKHWQKGLDSLSDAKRRGLAANLEARRKEIEEAEAYRKDIIGRKSSEQSSEGGSGPRLEATKAKSAADGARGGRSGLVWHPQYQPPPAYRSLATVPQSTLQEAPQPPPAYRSLGTVPQSTLQEAPQRPPAYRSLGTVPQSTLQEVPHDSAAPFRTMAYYANALPVYRSSSFPHRTLGMECTVESCALQSAMAASASTPVDAGPPPVPVPMSMPDHYVGPVPLPAPVQSVACSSGSGKDALRIGDDEASRAGTTAPGSSERKRPRLHDITKEFDYAKEDPVGTEPSVAQVVQPGNAWSQLQDSELQDDWSDLIATSTSKRKMSKKTSADFRVEVRPGDTLEVWLRTKRRAENARREFFFVHYCFGGEFHLGKELGYRHKLNLECWTLPEHLDFQDDDHTEVAAYFEKRWQEALDSLSEQDRDELWANTEKQKLKHRQKKESEASKLSEHRTNVAAQAMVMFASPDPAKPGSSQDSFCDESLESWPKLKVLARVGP